MIDRIIESTIVHGLAYKPSLLFDPGASAGQLTLSFVGRIRHELRRSMPLYGYGHRYWMTLWVPRGTGMTISSIIDGPKHENISLGDCTIYGMNVVGLDRADMETPYLIHGGILPPRKQLIIGIRNDEGGDRPDSVVFGCF